MVTEASGKPSAQLPPELVALSRTHPLRAAESALARAQAAGDAAERAVFEAAALGYLFTAGRFAECIESFHRCIGGIRASGNTLALARALRHCGVAYRYMGDFAAALGCFEEGLRVARAAGDAETEALVLMGIANLQIFMLDFEAADALFAQAFALQERSGDALGAAVTLGNRAYARIHRYRHLKQLGEEPDSGFAAATVADLERLHRAATEHGTPILVFRACLNRLRLALCLRDPEQAAAWLSRAEESMLDHTDAGAELDLCRAELMMLQGSADQALPLLERAISAARETQLQEELARAHRMLADTLEAMGRYRDALEARKACDRLLAQVRKDEARRRAVSFQLRDRLEALERETTHYQQVAEERRRSEELLLNILPAEIVEELKTRGSVAPKRFEEATVLFCDFAGFTNICSTVPAQRVLRDLDDIFRAFDEITRSAGLEKIKTVGDAYLAVAGVPAAAPDHARRCIGAGLRMLAYLEERNRGTSIRWNARVGVHSGPVIAGIVGRHKYAYDVFGDTVNTAARFCASSEPGRLNISAYTYDLVREEFACEHRGLLDAKGKGRIDMYFVLPQAGEAGK